MMDITNDIHSGTTFRRNPALFMKQLKNKRPVILTVKGRAEAVVQDAAAYQRLLDLAALGNAQEGIRQGLEEARAGKGRDIRIGVSEAARRWYSGLKAAVRSLCGNPGRSPVTPVDKSLRHLLYDQKPHAYGVIYRIREKEKLVEVLHIRHGARNEFDPEAV
jgi:prevent-host-death family protein